MHKPHSPEYPSDQAPGKGNQDPRSSRARTIAVRAGAVVLLAAVGATSTFLGTRSRGASPDQARIEIAEHQFRDPNIISVKDTRHVVDGQDELDIKLHLSTDPSAAADMKQYQASSAPVSWLVPSTLAALNVSKGANGKYHTGTPAFEAPAAPYIENEELNVKDGTALVTVFANEMEPIGDTVSLYTRTEAMSPGMNGTTKVTDGYQYLGSLRKEEVNGQPTWEAVPDHQPPLSDFADTSVATPITPTTEQPKATFSP